MSWYKRYANNLLGQPLQPQAPIMSNPMQKNEMMLKKKTLEEEVRILQMQLNALNSQPTTETNQQKQMMQQELNDKNALLQNINMQLSSIK